MSVTVPRPSGDMLPYAQSWVFSVLLHTLAVGSAVVFLGDLQLDPQPEPFKWDVALVETPQPTLMEQPAPAPSEPVAAKPVPPTEALVEPKPPVERRPLVPEPAPQPAQTVRAVQPVEQKVVQQAVRQEIQEPKPVKPLVQEIPKPVPSAPPVETIQEKPKERETVQAAAAFQTPGEPTVQTSPASPAPQPIQAVPAAPQLSPPSVVAAPPTVAAVPPAPVQEPAPVPVPAPESVPPPTSPAIQEAMARDLSARPASAAKADYGWLAKALWDRVAMLKRYPQAARLNHLEGRVVLRAVIKEDGHLMDLAVAESSGHSILDLDALEVLRKAMPLKLKQALGRSHVVVMVPISYRLEH